MLSRRRSVSARVRRALPRKAAIGRTIRCARNSRACSRDIADRVALIDGDRAYHLRRHRPNARPTSRCNLLELGLKPLDRVVVQLPNVAEFVILYFALQKIGAIPIAALATHRYAEISQFVELSGASPCVYARPRSAISTIAPMVARIQAANAGAQALRSCSAKPRPVRAVADRADRDAGDAADVAARRRSTSTPTDPAIFQLSGGTTGIPKLIPRTHNDYAYNSKIAAEVCDVDRQRRAAAGAADRAQPAAGVSRHSGLHVQRRQESC